MSQNSAIKAGRAFVELFADDSKLVSGLKKAKARMSAFGASARESGMKMIGLGGALVAPMLHAAKAWAEGGAEMAHMAQKTGMSVEALSGLSYAAEMSGLTMEDLGKGLFKMEKTLGDAARSGKITTDELQNLGLKMSDLKGLSPEDQFKLIADRISKVEDPAKRVSIAMGLFGRSGANLLPMMERGAKGIDEATAAAQSMGLVMDKDSAEAALKFDHALRTLWIVLKKVYTAVGEALAPVLSEVAYWMIDLAVQARNWIKEHQGMIQTAFKIAVAVMAAGAALVALGTAVAFGAKLLGGIIGVVSVVHAVLGALLPVIVALFSPLGMLAVLFIGVAVYILKATGAIDSALSWLGEGFGGLVDDCKQAVGAIGNALAKGDIGAAAKVLWLTLKLEWSKGVAALEKAWVDFKFGCKSIWEGISHAIVSVMLDLWYSLRRGWTDFWDWYDKNTESMAGWTAKRMIELEGMFDSSIDVEKQKSFVDKNVRQNLEAIDKEHDAKDKRLDDEEKAANRHNDASHTAELTRLSQERDAQVKTIEDEVSKARDEWNKALTDANAPEGDKPQRKGLDWLKGMNDLGDIEPIVGGGPKSSAVGTFNAMAIQGLVGGQSHAARTAKATEATQTNTKLLVDIVRNKPDIAFA